MSADEICVKAPAKINFGLKVSPRREDGFHPVEGIFQSVSLFDEIVVRRNGGQKCNVDLGKLGLSGPSTIAKAYDAFCDVVARRDLGVDVTVAKHIPAGGGLGGGSSDAASFVKALAELNGVQLSLGQKRKIASQVGSDVFFFLEAGTGCALVSGRGDIVKPIQSRRDLYLVLVFTGVYSGTKEAFELLDSTCVAEALEYPPFAEIEAVYRGPVKKWNFINSFTPSIAGLYPEIARAIFELKECGAGYAEMSGSGSTVYGVFASLKDAESACEMLAKDWRGCVVAQPFW